MIKWASLSLSFFFSLFHSLSLTIHPLILRKKNEVLKMLFMFFGCNLCNKKLSYNTFWYWCSKWFVVPTIENEEEIIFEFVLVFFFLVQKNYVLFAQFLRGFIVLRSHYTLFEEKLLWRKITRKTFSGLINMT